MQPTEIAALLKMVTTLILLLRESGVSKETIDSKLAEAWAEADALHNKRKR
jgi:lambda repressor-like predicted transcriptional regulator